MPSRRFQLYVYKLKYPAPLNNSVLHAYARSPTDSTSELNILRHDGNTLGMDGAQVGVFEETNKVGFGGFLKSQNGSTLETKVGLEILSNLTHKALERRLTDQEIGRLLVLADLTESNSSRTVAVGLLDSSSSWSGLTGSLKRIFLLDA